MAFTEQEELILKDFITKYSSKIKVLNEIETLKTQEKQALETMYVKIEEKNQAFATEKEIIRQTEEPVINDIRNQINVKQAEYNTLLTAELIPEPTPITPVEEIIK